MRWRNVGLIARYEFRTNFRRGGYLFATFGLPLLVLAAIAGLRWLAKHGSDTVIAVDPRKPVGVLDLTGTLHEPLPEGFVLASDQEEGLQAVRRHEWLALVVLRDDAQISSWVVYAVPGASFAREILDRRLLALRLYRDLYPRVRAEEVASLLEDPTYTLIELTEETAQERSTIGTMLAYGLSVAYFMALFSSTGYMLSSVAQEKESRMVEVLLSTVSSWDLLWGKLLGLAALGLTQVLVWSVISHGALKWQKNPMMQKALATWDWHFVALAAPALLLGYILFALLMAGLGALGNNLRESQQFATVVSMLGVLPLMLASLFFMNPNGLVPRVLTFIPWTAPLALILRLALAVVPRWEIAGSYVVMGIGVLISAWVGVRLFRVGILMFGKKPSWREVWHIVRHPD